jgi:diguanylate cyclase
MRLGTTPEEIENRRRMLLIALFAVVGATFLVPLGAHSVMNERLFLGLVLLANAALCLGLTGYAGITGRVERVRHTFAAQAALLALFLALHGGVNGSGIYFSFPLALMMVMTGFSGLCSGTVVCVVFLGVLALGLYVPFPDLHDYPESHRSRILMGFSALLVMALISEWMRVRSYSAITDTTEQLSVDAHHDVLTGLLNRRGLEQAVSRLEDADFPAVIALIDIDRFKQVNDLHGHDAGDVALRHLGGELRSNTKGRDLISRWGGEEFLVILTHTSLTGAHLLLKRVTEDVASHIIRHGDHAFHITFSTGMAELPGRAGFPEALKQADRYLYEAKQTGRNRIVHGDVRHPAAV